MALTTQQCREAVVEMAKSEPSLATLSKTDLIAAAVALDAFLSTNENAINNAFPAAFRNAATTPQKAAMLSFVALRRWGN